MHTALALAPLTLAAVLVVSGVAKAADLESTASVMRLLRLPGVAQLRGAPRLLVALELVTAALLVTPWLGTFRVGAALASALFIGFWVVVVRAMGFDPRPTCGCFGRIGDHRINGRTVVRNTVLVALAAVTAYLAVVGPAAGRLVLSFRLDDLLWLVMALALACVAVMILGPGPGASARPSRAQRAAAAKAADPAVDAEEELDYIREVIPEGVLIDRDHDVVTLRRLPRTGAQLLILVNCWCGPTHACIERIGSWRERLPQLGVHLVFATERPFAVAELDGLTGLWWDPGARVYHALKAGPSPSAVLLGADGLLAGGPVDGLDAVEQFIDEISAQLREADEASTAPSTA